MLVWGVSCEMQEKEKWNVNFAVSLGCCCLFTFSADASAPISMTREQGRDESVTWLMRRRGFGRPVETIFLVACFPLPLPSLTNSWQTCVSC